MPGLTYKPCACPATQTSSKHEILQSLRIKHALEVSENDKLFMNNP